MFKGFLPYFVLNHFLGVKLYGLFSKKGQDNLLSEFEVNEADFKW